MIRKSGNRKIWRTSAGGAIAFYVATIPDNTTTTFPDFYGDLPGQPIIATPWIGTAQVASVTYMVGDYVDGGNGYYFVVSGITSWRAWQHNSELDDTDWCVSWLLESNHAVFRRWLQWRKLGELPRHRLLLLRCCWRYRSERMPPPSDSANWTALPPRPIAE